MRGPRRAGGHASGAARARIGALGACVAGAVACQGLLGIEELTEESRPLAPGSTLGGAGGAGGAAPSVAGSGGAGVPGSVGSSAAGAAGSGDPASAEGSQPSVSGLDAGASADASPPSVGGSVVSGRVIDFFRRPVPDTAVTIGSTTAITGPDGAFSIDGVVPPYTASLIVNMIRGGGQARYGYVYEGLTRVDPTLQVYSALPERSASSLTVTFQNAFDTGQYAMLAFASADGRFVDGDTTNNTEFLGSPAWSGPPSITGNIHALLAQRESTFDPPVAFLAHQASPLGASDGLPASVGFDWPPSDITTGTIAGAVSGGLFEPRSNYVGLRFGDGAVLPIIDDTGGTPEFSYLVPALQDSTVFVAAADGSSAFPPYAVAHRENIAVGAADVALAVPRPVTLTSPQGGAAVNPSTPYVWSALAQTARTFLWHLEFDATYEGMFVLTSRTQIELPTFADGFTVPAGVAVTWSVETHGDAPDVDALAAPDGYLDAYSLGSDEPVGPNRSDGYYTESERRGFVMQ